MVLVLSIPVDVALDLEAHESMKARVRVGWLFGLVWKDIGQRRKKISKGKPKKKRKEKIKPLLSVLRTKGLPRGILKLARQMMSCLKVRQLDADLRVGLDEPADTGIMWSVLWPALVPLGWFGPVRFRMEPAFNEPAFEASLCGKIRLFPIQVIGYLLWFVLSPTGLRMLKSVVASRWK